MRQKKHKLPQQNIPVFRSGFPSACYVLLSVLCVLSVRIRNKNPIRLPATGIADKTLFVFGFDSCQHFRAMWFARGFADPLPSFDQEIGFKAAESDQVSWASHLDEFRAIRSSTLAFFRNLPEDAWLRSGVASDSSITVRAIAYIVAGHVSHHVNVLRERYL